jgi:hypothetical protein
LVFSIAFYRSHAHERRSRTLNVIHKSTGVMARCVAPRLSLQMSCATIEPSIWPPDGSRRASSKFRSSARIDASTAAKRTEGEPCPEKGGVQSDAMSLDEKEGFHCRV